MDINEIKKLKGKLENNIKNLIMEFEEDTGVVVNRLEIDRQKFIGDVLGEVFVYTEIII